MRQLMYLHLKCASLAILLLTSSCLLCSAQETIDLLTASDVARIEGEEDSDRAGVAIAACDINGDGIDDLLIGADEAHGIGNTKTRVGEAYILFGRRGRWSGNYNLGVHRDVRIVGQQAFDHLGIEVACGDVDGDGFGDIILSADNADSLADARDQAGQCHIIFGGTSLPALIDLAETPGTVIWGARQPDTLVCQQVGDVNGDGLLDIIAGADNSHSSNGVWPDVGKLHVIFGRSEWPSELDLLTGADVTIWGPFDRDSFASHLFSGDVDGDGIEDVIASARLGDGQNNSRKNAGDVYLFRGREIWPSEIDLEIESPDTILFGADAGDQAGEDHGIAVGDLDHDSSADLILSHYLGDGPANISPETGESRRLELGATLPPFVDLGVDYDSVIYGADSGDLFCVTLHAGDINDDGTDDLVCNATDADGPGGTRPGAGEVSIVLGHTSFPGEIDLSTSDPDFLIYAALESDGAAVGELSDINADGVLEIALSTATSHYGRPPAVWLVSPVDTDGDGRTNLDDNCPLVANAGQADGDGDLVGDACQDDYDGDGLPDEDDCAPGNRDGGLPAAVSGVRFAAGSTTELVWNQAPFAELYDISRGDPVTLPDADFGACQNHRDVDRSDLSFLDTDLPVASEAFSYLLRGQDLICPATGTWGEASTGEERINVNPSACP